MSIYTRVFHILMGILFIAGLASCGSDKDKSDGGKLSLIPSKPIVITADIQDGDQKVTGPWFKFSASMTNNTDETITVVALSVDITGQSATGSPVTTTVAFSPSSFNTSITVSSVEVECNYTHFAQIAPAATATFTLLGATDPGCPTGVQFTVGSNPKGPPGNKNFRYTLKVKPLGWFGTVSVPTDRFEKIQTFYTQ